MFTLNTNNDAAQGPNYSAILLKPITSEGWGQNEYPSSFPPPPQSTVKISPFFHLYPHIFAFFLVIFFPQPTNTSYFCPPAPRRQHGQICTVQEN